MRNFIRLLCCTFLLGACFSCGQERADTGQTNEGDSKSALELVNEKLLDSPSSPSLYVERSELFESSNDFPRALADVQRALTIDSLNSDYHTRTGRLHFKMTNIGAAKRSLEKGLSMNPKDTEAMLLLGELFFVLTNHDQAMTYINSALRIDEQLKKGYFLKGMIYKERGDTTLAVSSFQTVVELDPNDRESYLLLGKIHAAQRKPIALEYYDSAIAADPKNVEARYNKGIYFQENGEGEKAIEQYEEILAIDENYAVAHYNKGYVKLTLMDDVDAAIGQFGNAISKDPRYFQAYYNRAYCYELKGIKDSAVSDYNSCLSISANHPLAIEGLNRLALP